MILIDKACRDRIREENKKENAAPVLDFMRALEFMINRGVYEGTLDPERNIGA